MIGQDFQRDVTEEFCVMGPKHDTHTAFTKLRHDFICANARSWCYCHMAEIISVPARLKRDRNPCRTPTYRGGGMIRGLSGRECSESRKRFCGSLNPWLSLLLPSSRRNSG